MRRSVTCTAVKACAAPHPHFVLSRIRRPAFARQCMAFALQFAEVLPFGTSQLNMLTTHTDTRKNKKKKNNNNKNKRIPHLVFIFYVSNVFLSTQANNPTPNPNQPFFHSPISSFLSGMHCRLSRCEPLSSSPSVGSKDKKSLSLCDDACSPTAHWTRSKFGAHFSFVSALASNNFRKSLRCFL